MATAMVGIGSARATDPAVKCQERKLKARGKLELCLNRNAAAMLAGRTDASAACNTKFSDALTKAGTACRYLDNGDGTVTDLNTGLQWEKKDNFDGIVNDADPHDADNTYTWCARTFPNCTNSANPPDGTAYTDFLAKLNKGVSTDGGTMTPITGCFAGRCDWRLPSIVELRGIVDATQGSCGGGSGTCIDPAFGPTPSFYWSATSSAGLPENAWGVAFGNTVAYEEGKPYDIYVRAVRGGS
jgi:hypothetical protein